MQKLIEPLVEVKFKILSNSDINEIKCFTTRPDTLFDYLFSFTQTTLYLNTTKIMKNLLNSKKNAPKLELLRSRLLMQRR